MRSSIWSATEHRLAGRRLLLAAAVVTAALGAVALATRSDLAAALAGISAIAVASLSLSRSDADESVLGGDPARDVATDADLHVAGVTRSMVGMLDEASLLPTLRSRTEVARKANRPLSLVHLDVIEVTDDGRSRRGRDLDTAILDSTLRESDLCGRRADGVYVFILEDTGEDGAVWTAERLRRRLVERGGGHRYCAGIASFPEHALDATSLDAKAATALDAAREWRQDRIEVATGPT